MPNFQGSVIIISVILFILLLVLFAVLLYSMKNSSSSNWPPVVGDCPDYWVDLSGNGAKCSNALNLGTCSTQNTMNFSVAPYIGSNGLCAKYNWATACGLTWDGITYGVANPCVKSANPITQ